MSSEFPFKSDSCHTSLANDQLTGFGSYFESEAVPGALPRGQNSPQKVPFGLYAEQLSGSAFTAPRHENRRCWLYRLRPSASHRPYEIYTGARSCKTSPCWDIKISPNRLRWNPSPIPAAPVDFIDGMTTFAANGDAAAQAGIAIHVYVATISMDKRIFFNADGELLIVPQAGAILARTELGLLEVSPGQILVIPRGVRFAVDILASEARGYVCENYGAPFRLPELGPIGANGLANPRDFFYPNAAYEDQETATEVLQKFAGRIWTTTMDWSPLDVVAWHGNLAPYKYDLARFNVINTVSFDHPDPSIFTVLTSPSEVPGTANCDFVIFPPRWTVAENTFRPPWFHRNVMSEFMGLVKGAYDAKADGFLPGGSSLHNCMNGHGPDRESYEKATIGDLFPQKIENTLAFMFESRWVINPTLFALNSPEAQLDYEACWSGFEKAKLPK